MSERVDNLKSILTDLVIVIEKRFNETDPSNMEEVLSIILSASEILDMLKVRISALSKKEMKELLNCEECKERHSCPSYMEDKNTFTFSMNMN
ncbi:MAG: DUF810 domain-containing protein [Gammaproteobacteria bacterium]|uniref:Uncharacterized protein n=1 Tax=viral metagenome TaxID=1070528 RepID=A0A6M3ISB4_9ZZZZ|nr:DUF810 domain-containing protein [Gammaproteobacteria bacterium]